MADTTLIPAYSQPPIGAKVVACLAAALLLILTGCTSTPVSATVRPICFGGTEAAQPLSSASHNATSEAMNAHGPFVFAAPATSAEPLPALSDMVIRELSMAGKRDGVCATVIAGRGNNGVVTSVPISPVRANGQPERGSHRTQRLQQNIEALRTELAKAESTEPGLDPLGLMHKGVRSSPVPGTLVMVTTGVSTVAPVDLNELGWDADPKVVVAKLKAENWLPDLTGWRVIFVGLGDTAGTQPTLTPPLRRLIVDLWTAICTASGAAECIVDKQLVSTAPPTAQNQVPVVPLPTPKVSEDEVVLPAALLFTVDSTEIQEQARPALRAIAERAATRRITITGRTDATTGTRRHNDALSLERATAVAEALMRLGVPRSQIADVEGVGSAGYSARAEADDPSLISKHRTVIVSFLP